MADGQKPTHTVFVPRKRKDKDGKETTFYREVGSAWTFHVERGTGLSIKLDGVLPADGELVCFPYEEREKKAGAASEPPKL